MHNKTLMQQPVTVFANLVNTTPITNHAGKSLETLYDVFEFIKEHPNHKEIEIARQLGKSSPMYDNLKKYSLPQICWNATFSNGRKMENLVSMTGFMYGDVDKFDFMEKTPENERRELTKYLLKTLPYVYAVADSYGGKGIMFLVKAKDLTKDNFKATWLKLKQELAEMQIEMDEQTSNINRTNAITYDRNIYINEDAADYDCVVVEPSNTTEVVVEYKPQNNDEAYKIADNTFKSVIANWLLTNNTVGHMALFHAVLKCLHYGVPREVLENYVIDSSDAHGKVAGSRHNFDYVKNLIKDVYSRYGASFGKVIVKKSAAARIGRTFHGYIGNTNLKMEVLLGAAMSNYPKYVKSASDLDKLLIKVLESYATSCKRYGINISDAQKIITNNITFLNTELHAALTIEECEQIFTEIYNNNGIVFGVYNSALSIDEKKRRADYIQYKSANKFSAFEKYDDNYWVDRESIMEALGNIFSKIEKMMPDMVLDKAITSPHKIIQSFNAFLAECINQNIKKEYVLDFIDNLLGTERPYLNNNPKYWLFITTKQGRNSTFIVEDYYKYNSWKRGIACYKQTTMEDLKEMYKVSATYSLADNQRISDLKLPTNDNYLLWAAPGTGKTTWVCKYMTNPRILLVPVTGVLESLEHTYNCSVYYENKKNAKDGDNLIICTYSSFSKLMEEMRKWENGGTQYSIIFDEDHNFAVSSAKNFRGTELNEILLNVGRFRNFIRLTGTPFPIMDKRLCDTKIIKVEKEETPTRNYINVYYKNAYASLFARLQRGKLNLVYMQNKKRSGKLGEFIKYLNEMGITNIVTINADEKETFDYKHLITNETVSDQTEVIICTSVMVESLNIQNTNCATVHFLSFAHHIAVEQLVNRFRLKLPDTTYFYRPAKSKDEETMNDINVVQAQLKMQTYGVGLMEQIPSFDYNKDATSSLNKKLFSQISDLFKTTIRQYGIERGIDNLSISNRIFIEEERIERINPNYMEKNLAIYGWLRQPDEFDDYDIPPVVQHALDVHKEEQKEEKKQIIQELVDELCTLKDLDKFSDENRPTNEVEQWAYTLRSNVRYLLTMVEESEAYNIVSKWAIKEKMSSAIWDKKIRQLRIYLHHINNKTPKYVNFDFQSNYGLQFINRVTRALEARRTKSEKRPLYYPHEIADKFRKPITDYLTGVCNYKHSDITDDLIFNVVANILSLDIHIKNNIKMYRIEGHSIDYQVKCFNYRFYDWLTVSYNNNKKFSNEDVHNTVRAIRSSLPILRMELNWKVVNSVKIMHDFVDAKHQSAKKSKSDDGSEQKTTKLYGITALIPKWLENIKTLPITDDTEFEDEKLLSSPF